MKKVTTLLFLLALAVGAGAQSITVLPNAYGFGVGPTARGRAIATNSTVPPVAHVGPNATNGGKKK